MKILVIEDQRNHIIDAQRFFESNGFVIASVRQNLAGLEEFQNVVVFADNLLDCLQYISPKRNNSCKFDGVISDIHFPEIGGSGTLQPIGAMIIILCREAGIPCILNTDGHHHGQKNNWICQIGRELGLPEIVDAGDIDYYKGETVAEHKNWETAWEKLHNLILETQRSTGAKG